jgi:glycerol-3-phosphate dehydrogenase (NAD(P)+)
MIPEVAVVGATGWGTTVAMHIARQGRLVQLLVRDENEAARLNRDRRHPRLAEFEFPASLNVSADTAALSAIPLVIFGVPAQTMRTNLRQLAPLIGHHTVVAHLAKGLETETAKRMSEVIREEISSGHAAPIAVISGPNLSREVAAGLPSTTVVAADDDSASRSIQDLLMSPTFRVYTSGDVIGVELGGSLKNIVALGAGVADGLGLGDNAKAAFVTRGLAEITRLGVRAGAQPMTFQGLSGLGDLMATCYSPLSRNRRVGEQIAANRELDDILAELGEVAEGVQTVPAALKLAARLGVEMPITEQASAILFQGRSPGEALALLLEREPRAEVWGSEAAPVC